LREKFPNRKFALILGSDSLATLDKWKNHQAILDFCPIFVYPRPGTKKTIFDEHPSVHIVDAPLMDISSTFIRNAIKEGKNMNYFLHPKVAKYIDEMNFYKK
jgi:nicotinate-nucleotide adenylyltransferase